MTTAQPGQEQRMEACDHYKMVSGGNGPWTCVKCGAVDPPRPKYGTLTRPTADLGEELEHTHTHTHTLAQSALTLEEMAKVLRGVSRSGCADIADAQAKRSRAVLSRSGG